MSKLDTVKNIAKLDNVKRVARNVGRAVSPVAERFGWTVVAGLGFNTGSAIFKSVYGRVFPTAEQEAGEETTEGD